MLQVPTFYGPIKGAPESQMGLGAIYSLGKEHLHLDDEEKDSFACIFSAQLVIVGGSFTDSDERKIRTR